jgi:hypothetical protein
MFVHWQKKDWLASLLSFAIKMSLSFGYFSFYNYLKYKNLKFSNKSIHAKAYASETLKNNHKNFQQI